MEEEVPDNSEYQKLRFKKKQKLIERAKSLSDISRLQNGYSPIKHNFDSFESTSVMLTLTLASHIALLALLAL